MVVLQGGWHVWWLFATLQRQHHAVYLPATRSYPSSDSKTPLTFTWERGGGALFSRAAALDLVHFKCDLGMKSNYAGGLAARFNLRE